MRSSLPRSRRIADFSAPPDWVGSHGIHAQKGRFCASWRGLWENWHAAVDTPRRLWPVQCDRLAMRFKVHLGGITRMLVVIKKPGESLVPVRVGVSAVRQFCCLSAGQLMKGVTARLVPCDQGSASQLGHQAARRFRRDGHTEARRGAE